MRWIIAILFSLTATATFAATTGYYDWTNGQPAVILDSTDTTSTTTIDWTNGQPTAVEQFTQDAVAGNAVPPNAQFLQGITSFISGETKFIQ